MTSSRSATSAQAPSHDEEGGDPLALKLPSGPSLLCLDFDLTLTQTHLFHYTSSLIREGFKREEAILRAIQVMERQGPRGGEALWESLARWLKRGHGIAITSFTAFPELPIALLARGVSHVRELGAQREQTRWLSRPLVIYGDPAPSMNPPRALPHTELITPHPNNLPQPRGKNLHIAKALEVLARRGISPNSTILMDDDPHNIELAQAGGYDAIEVNQRDLNDLTHLARLDVLINNASDQ